MENIFVHDASPTWSGFIYQGELAIYLAVKKICDLRDQEKVGIDKICSDYYLELEKCEDIAILYEDSTIKEYISIHQVKNQKDKDIGSYRSPLVQLMLEKAFYTKYHLGNPKSYLHTSKKINESGNNTIEQSLEQWKLSITQYYDKLKEYMLQINETTIEQIVELIKKEVEHEPIKLNRKEYRELKEEVKTACSNESADILKIKEALQKLTDFLENELSVPSIESCVQLYLYEDQNKYCSSTDVFKKIVEQVKRYYYDDNSWSDLQYEYITDKLISHMRKHVLERHQKIQLGSTYAESIQFSEINNILNEDLTNYEKEANVLALRRLYDERLSEYCTFECGNECMSENNDIKECKLKQTQFRRVDLSDSEFIKLCYSFNPDCENDISNRICIGKLLNEDGLNESVFEVLKNVPETFLMNIQDRTKFIVNNQDNNAFLTAISSKNSSKVVQDIVNGIENNSELVSPIFDADELITTRLDDDESVWCNDFSEIQDKYMQNVSTEDNQNSICNPKKPRFVKAEEVIETLLSNE